MERTRFWRGLRCRPGNISPQKWHRWARIIGMRWPSQSLQSIGVSPRQWRMEMRPWRTGCFWHCWLRQVVDYDNWRSIREFQGKLQRASKSVDGGAWLEHVGKGDQNQLTRITGPSVSWFLEQRPPEVKSCNGHATGPCKVTQPLFIIQMESPSYFASSDYHMILSGLWICKHQLWFLSQSSQWCLQVQNKGVSSLNTLLKRFVLKFELFIVGNSPQLLIWVSCLKVTMIQTSANTSCKILVKFCWPMPWPPLTSLAAAILSRFPDIVGTNPS